MIFFEAINLELLKSEFQQYFLMRDFESGLGVLWDDGRVSAMIFQLGSGCLIELKFPGIGAQMEQIFRFLDQGIGDPTSHRKI